MSKKKINPLSINFGVLEAKTEKWKKIAVRFARSIVRFQGNDLAANLPDSTIALARRIATTANKRK